MIKYIDYDPKVHLDSCTTRTCDAEAALESKDVLDAATEVCKHNVLRCEGLVPAAGLLLVNLRHMMTPAIWEVEKTAAVTAPHLFSLGKHRMFIDMPARATDCEPARYAGMYYRAFSNIPEQWLEPV